MKQPQSAISLEFPLGTALKCDPRSIIPVNHCKAVAILQSSTEINSQEKAAREVEELHKRNQEKLRNHEEFLKKTKERLKAKKIANNEKVAEDAKKDQLESFTFLNNNPCEAPVSGKGEKTAEFPQETTEKTVSFQKIWKPKPKAAKISKNSEKVEKIKEKLGQDLKSESAVPRFINVANMKISYNPEMLKPAPPKPTQIELLATPPKSTPGDSSRDSAKSKKFQDQMRYSTALKDLVSSQLRHSNSLKSASVCGCMSSNNPKSSKLSDCANNCPFYKKQGEYQRALKEMLSSFKASE